MVVPKQRMMKLKAYDLIIDGGTTNTRFTLLDQNKIILRTECKVGAANADSSTANELLKSAVKEKIAELKEQNECIMKDIYASGMITSNAGLFELPHLEAPVSLKSLAAGIRSIKLPEICEEAVFHFIPGIRFDNQPYYGKDMLRGEEVEIIGILEPEYENKTILFMHFGSHNKLMYYADGAIQNAITTIGGELLWAIINDTILKSSVAKLDEPFTLKEKYVKIGYKETKKNNISRSMFQGRIHQVIENASKEQILSYIYGAIMCIDFQAFTALLELKTDKFIVYGRDTFIKAFNICLPLLQNKDIKGKEIKIISYEESEWLSVKGVQRIRDIGLSDVN